MVQLKAWVILVSLVLATAAEAQHKVSEPIQLSAAEIAEASRPSVVLLWMAGSSMRGSGFVVETDVVATNLHVIEGASRGVAIIGDSEEAASFDVAGCIALDSENDLALLSIPDLPAPSLRLSSGPPPKVGERVYADGYPKGLRTFTDGIVSQVRDGVLQISAPISQGSSGGPVFDEAGKVVGVATATWEGAQNLNFAIPASRLAELLRRRSATPTPLSACAPSAGITGPPVADVSDEEAFTGSKFAWTYRFSHRSQLHGAYSFSITNTLRRPVRGISCLVGFFDRAGEPVETELVHFPNTIPGGLARRVTGEVDSSVQNLGTTAEFRCFGDSEDTAAEVPASRGEDTADGGNPGSSADARPSPATARAPYVHGAPATPNIAPAADQPDAPTPAPYVRGIHSIPISNIQLTDPRDQRVYRDFGEPPPDVPQASAPPTTETPPEN